MTSTDNPDVSVSCASAAASNDDEQPLAVSHGAVGATQKLLRNVDISGWPQLPLLTLLSMKRVFRYEYLVHMHVCVY